MNGGPILTRQIAILIDGGFFLRRLPKLGLAGQGADTDAIIGALTLKRFVGTIVLVSGDSDFVPAAKLARREGIQFILDPMWQSVTSDLFEHIDGLQSGLPKPRPTQFQKKEAA